MRAIKISITIIMFITILSWFQLSDTVATVNEEIVIENEVVETNINIRESLVEIKTGETMRASWYGPKFHGKLTANGEIYDQMALTAAHKTLPFGTMLRLTNPANNKSIIVRINDRGPYIKGRHIDLSKAAAIALESLHEGVINVEVQYLSLNKSMKPFASL